MSGGQFPVPVVIRMATGAGRQLAAQHSHSLEAWYASVPGLRVVEPATIDDARGMLRVALASPDPVIVFEPISLYNMEGELTAAAGNVQLEGARVHRAGSSVTLVTYGASLWRCVAGAEVLARDGIDAEIVDLRSLRPLDDATVLDSVRRTRRVVIVDEGWRTCSLAAEIGQRIVEQGFYDLDAPIARVCTEEVPIPYPKHLEDAALPGPERIVSTVRRLLGHAD
jgi:pyruvate/2-oxoglutarate/acetoin dehydrogenase E1 component